MQASLQSIPFWKQWLHRRTICGLQLAHWKNALARPIMISHLCEPGLHLLEVSTEQIPALKDGISLAMIVTTPL